MAPLWTVGFTLIPGNSFKSTFGLTPVTKSKWITKQREILSSFKQAYLVQSPHGLPSVHLPNPLFLLWCAVFQTAPLNCALGDTQLHVNECGFFKRPAWTLCFQVSAPSSTLPNEVPFQKTMCSALCARSDSTLRRVSVGGEWASKGTNEDLEEAFLSSPSLRTPSDHSRGSSNLSSLKTPPCCRH